MDDRGEILAAGGGDGRPTVNRSLCPGVVKVLAEAD